MPQTWYTVKRYALLLTDQNRLTKKPTTCALARRDFLVTAAAATTGLALAGRLHAALAAEQSADFKRAYADLLKGATPIEAKINLDIDPYVEHGSMVFYRFTVDHPMHPDDYVKRVHLLSTENPFAHVASFNFTPQSGKASIAGRMRLAKTQNVVAIAELTGDQLYVAKRYVEVGIGGCES